MTTAAEADKKNEGGALKFVLPTRLGEVVTRDVGEREVRAVLGGG